MVVQEKEAILGSKVLLQLLWFKVFNTELW